ncbi:MAG: ABC transporter substrate-binding protein [Hyphomicrobiales bacterium]|nr:MAG: ABC transporter substrate-binding protein [Hyphomicrobiales bacterium]
MMLALAMLVGWGAGPGGRAVAQARPAAKPPAVKPAAAKPAVPRLWRPVAAADAPDVSEIKQLRVLTTSDYPPFNYVDRNGWLTGLNVDLLRALCSEMKLKCEIKAAPWERLVEDLKAGRAEAVMAGMAVTEANLRRVSFTRPYIHMSARFAVLRSSPLKKFDPVGLAGKRIGVVNNSAHEAYLKDMFPRSDFVPYPNDAAARKALRAGKVEALFGDGVKLSLWVRGSRAQKCCHLRGGPYTESRYFGDGMAVAVKRGNTDLARVLDYGFARLFETGKYAELVNLYLPGAFFGSPK